MITPEPPDLSRLAWRKSRRSGTDTNCVEVAPVPESLWRKSSRSGTHANCVEVARVPTSIWRKSSRSGSHANCVEVASLPAAVAVRDSKDRTGPTLLIERTAWAAFVTAAKCGNLMRSVPGDP